MTIPATQLENDREQMFADWAVSITFREVISPGVYDDTAIDALLGPQSVGPDPDGAAGELLEEIAFVVRTDDLPVSPAVEHRVVYNAIEYDIVREETAPHGLTTTLHVERVIT